MSEQALAEPAFSEGDWKFDERVTAQFDQMLERSIPQYELMRQSCYAVGSKYVQPNTDIVDLGCSRGEAVKPFIDDMGARNRFVLIEASEPMAQATRKRYECWIDSGRMSVWNKDLRTYYPSVQASLTLSILTTMFVPIEYRQRLIRKVFLSTLGGGAFILVEKILGATAELDENFVLNYYQMKAAHDYSHEEIERKRLALEGKLVPVTARWNEELLTSAGFRQVDCFWRFMNFAAWIAVKE